ncbi:MAG: hypothetical protein P4L98_02560 [Ancalomicrobiaceae bacterium]|nr:hypothetical protein [Ancalomicrobiaceae bacterium]
MLSDFLPPYVHVPAEAPGYGPIAGDARAIADQTARIRVAASSQEGRQLLDRLIDEAPNVVRLPRFRGRN